MRAPREPFNTPAKMKQAREYLGFTKEGLAQHLGLRASGRQTVRRWETEPDAYGPARKCLELMVEKRKAGL